MFELMDAYSQSAVIKVIGVGGGGGNAVTHMVTSGISYSAGEVAALDSFVSALRPALEDLGVELG